MAKKKRPRRKPAVRMVLGNPDSPLAFIRIAGKSMKDAKRKAARFRNRHLKNISEGFRDANGEFHPIRAAPDYSPRRAGETKVGRKRKTAKKLAARSRRARSSAIS
jgi:hypothetical protein